MSKTAVLYTGHTSQSGKPRNLGETAVLLRENREVRICCPISDLPPLGEQVFAVANETHC